ncbi:phenolic acid decarboxylase [Crocinitomix catalasitica]|uniref:phenolic acid decarboxylase n=1 Tax=Crocinitomix catalasitica TaxID=184607 RepID=UPI0012FC2700|nr:phenolic acid decarboxylase [Crocinitomix catalasitica]
MKKYLLLLPFTLILLSCGQEKETIAYPDKLMGMELNYTYSGGNEYVNKYTPEGIYYQYRTGGSPEKWFGPMPYNYKQTTNNEHLISWFEPKRGDYVTLLINFEEKTVFGSAIVGQKRVHFQEAELKYAKLP